MTSKIWSKITILAVLEHLPMHVKEYEHAWAIVQVGVIKGYQVRISSEADAWRCKTAQQLAGATSIIHTRVKSREDNHTNI